MNVNFDGRTYSFEVKPGPDGYRQFTEAIRRAFSLPEDSELNITFTCDEPSTGWEPEPPSPSVFFHLSTDPLGRLTAWEICQHTFLEVRCAEHVCTHGHIRCLPCLVLQQAGPKGCLSSYTVMPVRETCIGNIARDLVYLVSPVIARVGFGSEVQSVLCVGSDEFCAEVQVRCCQVR
jgi:hypothetical protein